jgi:hypothetical protein
MRNKLIAGLLGLAIVVAGIAAFAAFTAQIVNLEAHVEKEIEVSAVKNCRPVGIDIVCDEDNGNYGTVIPQELYDKDIEVTLSKSFVEGQTTYADVVFAVMWECKQNGTADAWNNLSLNAAGKYNLAVPDGFPDCRNRLPHTDPLHPNGELDDNLRNYATIVTTQPNCLTAAPPSGVNDGSKKPAEKQVELKGFGTIFKGSDLTKKCFYQVKLLAPPCEGEFNPFTDPAGPTVKTIACHFIKPSGDPQTWEHSADIGDDFKIQVIEHSTPVVVIP